MADQTKSNPSFLIIGVVVFIVAVFFVGNIVACVPRPVPPPITSLCAAPLTADSDAHAFPKTEKK